MKKYFFLTLILIAGMTVYPQSTKTERETKKEKTAVRKTTTRQSAGKAQQKNRKAEAQSQETTGTQARKQAETQSNNKAAENQARFQTESRARTKAATEVRNQAATETRSRSATQNARAQKANTQTVTRTESSGRKGQTAVRNNVRTSPQKSSARINRSNDPGKVRIRNSAANRVYREDKGTLTFDNGTVRRHQNDQVFTGNRFKVDYDNYATLRRSNDFMLEYRNYNTWYDGRYIRNINYYNTYRPLSLEIRRQRFEYRRPMDYELIWTPTLFNRFMYYYPNQTDWNFEFGNEIETISSYDVGSYIGTVKRIYGKVEEVYYSREDQNYVLYLGDRFPYQDLSVVIPRNLARQFSRNPEFYFRNEYVWLVGLIDLWEDKPEIIIRDIDQIRKY